MLLDLVLLVAVVINVPFGMPFMYVFLLCLIKVGCIRKHQLMEVGYAITWRSH